MKLVPKTKGFFKIIKLHYPFKINGYTKTKLKYLSFKIE